MWAVQRCSEIVVLPYGFRVGLLGVCTVCMGWPPSQSHDARRVELLARRLLRTERRVTTKQDQNANKFMNTGSESKG